MRVLIIGTGYIGLPLGAELAHRGHDVSGLRRDKSRSAGDVLRAANIKLLAADITQPGELVTLPRDFDWVVNCVASSGGGAEEYRRIYLRGMRNIVDWLFPVTGPGQRDSLRNAAGGPRIIYTSSTSVYGQNDGSMVDETSPTEPLAETARVLLEAERELLAASQQKNFDAIILRVAGIYGPGRGHWFQQFLKGDARIEGRGERFLNMIHREDVVDCIIAALECGQGGEIYNAVDDEPVSQLDFFSWLAETLGKPMPDSVSESFDGLRKRGITNKKISNKKLKNQLSYRFNYPTFREGYTSEIHELVRAGKISSRRLEET